MGLGNWNLLELTDVEAEAVALESMAAKGLRAEVDRKLEEPCCVLSGAVQLSPRWLHISLLVPLSPPAGQVGETVSPV